MAGLFVAEGADVIIAARRREEGEELAEALGASFFATDVTVEADVKALIAHALELAGLLLGVAALTRLLPARKAT
jgi:NAD(P)-dependent dehydrogenase (short-subunit alcohol dehydrogenase family)